VPVYSTPCFVAAGFRLRPVDTSIHPVEKLTRPTVYPASLSAQIHGWLCSNGEPREQAHLPAEQPSSGQDPRLPSAHANPSRSCHLGCSSPQGSLQTFRLRLGACCRRVIDCEAVPTLTPFFGGHVEQVDLIREAATSSCMPTRPTHAGVNRRGSVLLSPRLWAMRWRVTVRSGCYELL
jgi:hypothetical protein